MKPAPSALLWGGSSPIKISGDIRGNKDISKLYYQFDDINNRDIYFDKLSEIKNILLEFKEIGLHNVYFPNIYEKI